MKNQIPLDNSGTFEASVFRQLIDFIFAQCRLEIHYEYILRLYDTFDK